MHKKQTKNSNCGRKAHAITSSGAAAASRSFFPCRSETMQACRSVAVIATWLPWRQQAHAAAASAPPAAAGASTPALPAPPVPSAPAPPVPSAPPALAPAPLAAAAAPYTQCACTGCPPCRARISPPCDAPPPTVAAATAAPVSHPFFCAAAPADSAWTLLQESFAASHVAAPAVHALPLMQCFARAFAASPDSRPANPTCAAD